MPVPLKRLWAQSNTVYSQRHSAHASSLFTKGVCYTQNLNFMNEYQPGTSRKITNVNVLLQR